MPNYMTIGYRICRFLGGFDDELPGVVYYETISGDTTTDFDCCRCGSIRQVYTAPMPKTVRCHCGQVAIIVGRS